MKTLNEVVYQIMRQDKYFNVNKHIFGNIIKQEIITYKNELLDELEKLAEEDIVFFNKEKLPFQLGMCEGSKQTKIAFKQKIAELREGR